MIRAALLLAAVLASANAWAADPPQEPVLRVEAGAHVGAVTRVAVDASGRLLATASFDKTVRLWSLPDGMPRGVLRPAVGTGPAGELYALALAPDGKRVFAAGATGGAWDGTFSVDVFDVQRQAFAGLLGGLPAPVNALAVSRFPRHPSSRSRRATTAPRAASRRRRSRRRSHRRSGRV